MEQNTFAAIEIGETQTKVVVANYYANRLCVVASSKVKTYGVTNGEITNRKEVLNSLQQALALIKEQGYEIDQALVVLPAKKMNVYRKRSAISIISSDHVITSRDVKELTQTFARGATPGDDLIVNIIPLSYVLDEDRTIYEEPIGLSARNVKFDCFVITLPTHIARGVVDVIQDCGIDVLEVLVAPVCDLNLLVEQKEANCILVNIGGYNSTISHVTQGKIVACNTIRYGGNNLTNEIAKAFGIEPVLAENIKRRFGNANLQSSENIIVYDDETINLHINEKQLTQTIGKRLDELIFELNKVIKILVHGANLPIYLTGGGADLKGFDEQLKTFFGGNVVKYNNPFIGARSNEFTSCLGIINYCILRNTKKRGE